MATIDFGSSSETDVLSDTESDTEYVVEEILKHRRKIGEVQFLIKWEGYPADEATWESEENLTGCSKLLTAYKNIHMQRGRKRKSDDDSFVEPTTSGKPNPKSRGDSESSSASDRSLPSVPQAGDSISPQKKRDESHEDDDAKLPDVMPNPAPAPIVPAAANNRAAAPFDIGVAKKVLGVTRYPDNSLWILVAWTDPKMPPELVPNHVANEKIPELMIAYYEKHLQWQEYTGRKKN